MNNKYTYSVKITHGFAGLYSNLRYCKEQAKAMRGTPIRFKNNKDGSVNLSGKYTILGGRKN